MYWWDNGILTHDLCEEPTDLCITGTDACSGSNINIEYLLFLDLDGDNVMETVVNSTSLGIAGLGWNNVLYGNINTPDFSGGIAPVRRAQCSEQPEVGLLDPGDYVWQHEDCLRSLEHPAAAEHPRDS
ncbi:MAG: hypothetical protein IPH31_24880 [Lewinellaceae bacterium]|nr:hypothetical protein [Lewinellaceae bacterium]